MSYVTMIKGLLFFPYFLKTILDVGSKTFLFGVEMKLPKKIVNHRSVCKCNPF